MQLSPPLDSQQVVRHLTELMKNQNLAPGDRLPSIRQLAAALQVSTSVVRDALLKAQAMGVVKLYPRSGAFVESIERIPAPQSLESRLSSLLQKQDENLVYLLNTRKVLEIESVTLAAERRHIEDLVPVRQSLATMHQITGDDRLNEFVQADIDFHLGIARAAGNPVLVTVLTALFEHIEPFLKTSFLGSPWNHERRVRTLDSHREIYQAVLDKDAERARKAIDDHLRLALEKLIRNVECLEEQEANTP